MGPEHQISPYSREDVREYLAEGFMHYHTDPKSLKSKDPALFEHVRELVERASALQAGRVP